MPMPRAHATCHGNFYASLLDFSSIPEALGQSAYLQTRERFWLKHPVEGKNRGSGCEPF